MTGIILTVKHHDGFCLWPSAYTEHSVKNAPWKDGKGDVVRELSDACKEYGLKLGIYYSPWDRNHADYGKPEYITYMRNQLRELMTNYGEVWEVWFDGANGGTGYYGGAREDRRVDKKTYYDMQNTYPIIRELQPDALIFSDAGPDVRWVGNEEGYAFRTMWSNLLRDSVYAGMPEYSQKYASGQEEGTHWVPGETNVSIRPGWYYHPYEDHKVRSVASLVDMYYNSIGRNTTWLLNFPVDTRGLIHENDVEALQKLTKVIRDDFSNPLLRNPKIITTNHRGHGFEGTKAVDDDPVTYWAASDGIVEASLTIDMGQQTTFNRFLIQEHIALGQRIKAFTVEAKIDGTWKEIARETTIGYKRILRLPEVTADAIKVNILDAKACPTISHIQLFLAPPLIVPPTVSRDREGVITLAVPDTLVDVFYTLDGSDPGLRSSRYTGPFVYADPVNVTAVAIHNGKDSDMVSEVFDIAPIGWQVQHSSEEANYIIDGNPNTWWESATGEVVIDLGKEMTLKGFTYLPMQGRWITGFIESYMFMTSMDGRNWELASQGEFANILNSPILQRITFAERQARYIKLQALKTVEDTRPAYAEISIITQ